MAITTAPARPGRAAQEAPARPPRDPWFDNAKMVLVTLVVVGHSWTLLPETTAVSLTYNWLYLWHVPAFVLVTGYLSRSFNYSRRNLRRLVTNVVLPYLVFEGLFALFRVHVGGEKLERLWLNPHWPMWYLAVLFLWRLATPALRRLGPLAVPVAIAVSLLGGLFATEVFDLNRALGLLPFFTMGLMAEPRHLEWMRGPGVRRVAPFVLVGGIAAAVTVESRIVTEWLYFRSSYAQLDTSWVDGMGIRLLLIGCATAMTLAALSLVPRTGGWFSRLGSASLVIYLFHGFFVKGAEYAGFAQWAGDRALPAFLLVTGLSVAVALTLSWRPVRKPLTKVITPAP